MKSNAIVTLADSNYFELLIELISSIKNFNQSKNISICVLDAGLSSDQVNILKEKVDEVKKANWDIEVSKLKAIGKEWLKSQISRAFPSASPSLMSTTTTSLAISRWANTSAHVAPTLPAPTTVIFIIFSFFKS